MTPVKVNSAQMASAPLSVHRQKGFTLLEALVAFLILSIGMLGIASLQLISLKAGHTAAFRTVVVHKVDEMFERIRNNPTQVTDYDTIVAADNSCNDYSGVISCNSADLAAYDKFEWEQGLISSLSANAGVTTTITVTNPVPGTLPLAVVTITINWQERDPDTQAMVTKNYSSSADICNTTAC